MKLQSFPWFQNRQTPASPVARTFRFRLNSTHIDPGNAVATLHVEQWTEEAWHPFNLGIQTPGFLIFSYSCFICQHTSLRINAAEFGLPLAFMSGTFSLSTTQSWKIQSIHTDFEVYLNADTMPDVEDHNELIRRINHCPVSRNLEPSVSKHIQLAFHPLQEPSSLCSVSSGRSRQQQGLQRLTNSTLLSLNSSIL